MLIATALTAWSLIAVFAAGFWIMARRRRDTDRRETRKRWSR